ncbi:hypothetical protein BCR33DRAFT_762021, partial [Rhizoclosmatium globosum]
MLGLRFVHRSIAPRTDGGVRVRVRFSTTKAADTSLAARATGFLTASAEMAKLYYNGAKQLYRNSKDAGALIKHKRQVEASGGKVEWSRSQFLMVQQTSIDMKKLPPFLILLLLVPETIPFILIFNPAMIPSTCVSLAQKQKLWAKLKERRETIANGWIEHLTNNDKSPLGWASQIPLEQFKDPKSVVHLAKHAPQYFEPNNMSRGVLKSINLGLGLSHRVVFASTLRKALEKHWETVHGDDLYLAGRMPGEKVGISSLSELELWEAAEMRGISTTGKSRASIESELKSWLATSMNEENVKIPSGLMYMSTFFRQTA